MPKLNWNAFLGKHKSGICIEFVFGDYHDLQASMRRARATGARIVKSGKVLPTPNAVMTKLAAEAVKGDYTIRADGPIQTLLFANGDEAKHVAKEFKATKKSVSPDRPCTAAYQRLINMDAHKALAVKFGLY